MKKFLSYLCVIFLFSSCFNTAKRKSKELSVFRYNEPGGINWLDPAKMSKYEDFLISYQIFNGLVMLDHEMNLKPCIANKYDISSDGKTYTFHLRRDVVFHESPLIDPLNNK